MVEEAYVSFEIAKLLKEKGFNEECSRFYMPNGNGRWKYEHYHDFDISGKIECPTLQMVMRWLREVHNIHINICSIWDSIRWLYQVFVITPRTSRNSYVDKILYPSYEQACEVAIKYCLENLI